MGLRSAFNPLGALPYSVTVSYTTVSWDVGGLVSGVYPASWKLWDGDSTFDVVPSSSVSSVNASESTVNGELVVTFSCTIPSGLGTVTNIDVNDSNFSETVSS